MGSLVTLIFTLFNFILSKDVFTVCSIGQSNISSSAKWAFSATTVGGSATGASGSTSSLLYFNSGIRISDSDTLYIVDKYNNRVVVVSPNSTTAVATIGSGYGIGPTQMNFPSDTFVTSDGIYVLDTKNYRVQKWLKNGINATIVAGITGTSGGTPGGTSSNTTFSISFGLFVDIYGNIYVSDQVNHRVLRFSSNSSTDTSADVIAGTGTVGYGPSQLYNPSGIFVDSDLTLYIADTYNQRIQRWKFAACSGMTVAGRAGQPGNTLYMLQNPSSVIVDNNGYMYICDQNNHRILRWAPETCAGECIAGCSMTPGTRPDQLYYPFSIAFDSKGSLYVSDTRNNRVQKFAIINYNC
ncbi:unnamed protein product, partial [Rotaria sp. Silwood2]